MAEVLDLHAVFLKSNNQQIHTHTVHTMYSSSVLLLFNKVIPTEINNLFSVGDLAKTEAPRLAKVQSKSVKITTNLLVCAWCWGHFALQG